MKIPIIIVISVVAVLALMVYFLIAPQSVSISNTIQSSVFEFGKPTENNPDNTMEQTKLQITDEKTGTGDPVKTGDRVSVHYRGTLQEGTEFDSSYKRNQPFSFTVGAGEVIQGWEQGLVGMKMGGKRKLIIPPELGYGSTGAGGVIPPNATLIFEIELIEIE